MERGVGEARKVLLKGKERRGASGVAWRGAGQSGVNGVTGEEGRKSDRGTSI